MGSTRVSFIGGLVMLGLTLAAVYAVQAAVVAAKARAPEPRDDDDESTDH